MDGSSFLAAFASDHEIRFNGGTIDTFPVKGEKVTILPSPGDHEVGSSKLKITNIVNYGWEHKFHPGQLVAVHKAGVYFAYGVATPGKNLGVVRVVQRESEERILVKGMRGKVKDLAFAHCTESIILGVVDELANIFIYRIEEHQSDRSLKAELILQIDSDVTLQADTDLKHLRLIWCPYLPDEDADDDSTCDDSSSRLFVVTKGTVAEIFHVDAVINQYGNGPMDISSVTTGRLKVTEHRGAITDASFSPDGTAIATACADGLVKFFQVYMHETETPRCLHQWSPHDNKPLSSLFFLDNHLNYNPDEQFWKYVVTGSNRNTELKIWSCESWTCKQTINFATPSPSTTELKASLDLSAKYLLLSDIHRKNVYVLRIDENDAGSISVVSVSEFATPSAFLSMAILEGGIKTVKETNLETEDPNSASDSDEDEAERESRNQAVSKESTVIKFLLVQPKSLQECQIIFEDVQQTSVSTSFEVPSSPLKESKSSPLKSSDMVRPKQEPSHNGPITVTGLNGGAELQKAADKITLMSPEVFESKPIIKEEPQDNGEHISTPLRGATLSFLPTRQLLAGASGTGSPSREVADILGTADGDDEIDLNVEYVVTEENDDDEEDDDEDGDSDDVAIFDEIALKKEEEEFANLDKILIKQEMKTEGEETEDTDDEDPLNSSVRRIKQEPSMSPSAPPILIKQESILLGSPSASSLPLMKQESQSGLVLKQELPGIDSTPPFLTSNPSLLSRSFDHVAPAPDHQSAMQFNHQMERMMKKLNDMASLIQTQRAEMQVLREEVRALHSNDLKQVEGIIKNTSKNQSLQIAESSKRDTKALLSGLSQTIHNSMGTHLEREVKSLAPAIAQLTAETVHQNLTREVKNRLTKADDSLREAIMKMAQSKSAMDSMAQALAATIQPSLQSAFRDMFSNILVPAFEKSTQTLFTSLNGSFNKGCREYEAQLKQHVGRQLDPVSKEIRESLEKVASQQASSRDQQILVEKSLRELEIRLLAGMKDLVVQEVRQALAIHSANLTGSLSATPTLSPAQIGNSGLVPAVPTFQELQASVNLQLSQGKWNEAFQTALMANNLSLVVSTCESVNPTQLFSQNKCPLSQSVLLSLIQQLAHNLDDKTEVKHKYLEEAVMNLDPENVATKKHMEGVVGRLQKQLDAFIKANPDKIKITRQMRVLHMATQGLVNQK